MGEREVSKDDPFGEEEGKFSFRGSAENGPLKRNMGKKTCLERKKLAGEKNSWF